MRLTSVGERQIKRTVTILLIIGMLGRIWTLAVYPPFGNAKIFVLSLVSAVFVAAACYGAAWVRTKRVSDLYERLKPVMPITAVSTALTLWATVVYLVTDTLTLLRLGHFVMGIGLVGVVWFAVDSSCRIRLVVWTVILAAVLSALYGLLVAANGDPYMTVWIILSKVDLDRIRGIVAGGRIAGLSQNVIAFSYILASATPLLFALLVIPREKSVQTRSNFILALLGLSFVLLMSVLLLNATRSAILGAVGGCVVVGVALLMFRLELWKRLGAVVVVASVCILLIFVLASTGVIGFLGKYPMPEQAVETVSDPSAFPSHDSQSKGLEETFWGRALIRTSQPGWPSDKDSYYEIELREKIALARGGWQEDGVVFDLNMRVVGFGDTSARARIPMALTALRYSLDHPLGTGRYSPEERHVPSGLEPKVAEEVLRTTPHNQFLVVLVYYGYPGLALLIVFYLLVGRSLLLTARRSLRLRDTESMLLAAAVTGSLAGYGLNSLFHNAGPFVGDWFHFITVGLVFSIERLSAERESSSDAA